MLEENKNWETFAESNQQHCEKVLWAGTLRSNVQSPSEFACRWGSLSSEISWRWRPCWALLSRCWIYWPCCFLRLLGCFVVFRRHCARASGLTMFLAVKPWRLTGKKAGRLSERVSTPWLHDRKYIKFKGLNHDCENQWSMYVESIRSLQELREKTILFFYGFLPTTHLTQQPCRRVKEESCFQAAQWPAVSTRQVTSTLQNRSCCGKQWTWNHCESSLWWGAQWCSFGFGTEGKRLENEKFDKPKQIFPKNLRLSTWNFEGHRCHVECEVRRACRSVRVDTPKDAASVGSSISVCPPWLGVENMRNMSKYVKIWGATSTCRSKTLWSGTCREDTQTFLPGPLLSPGCRYFPRSLNNRLYGDRRDLVRLEP